MSSDTTGIKFTEHHVGFRDAIHVPFIVVRCKAPLQPGEKVSLRDRNWCVPWGGLPEPEEPDWHGVVNPFLDSIIPPETPFEVYIRKECFSRLRHDFIIETRDDGGTETCHAVCNIF